MGRTAEARVRRAAAALALVAGLLGGAAPARAAEAPLGATTTVVLAAPETKIVLMEPASTTTTTTNTTTPIATSGRATLPTPAPVRAQTAATTPMTIASVSPALRALVEASAAERRRLSAEITELEGRVAGLEADLAAAQSAVATQGAGVGELEALAGRARIDMDQAGGRVSLLEASASSATEALQVQRTIVARPPTPGHTREDAAARARTALAAAVDARGQSSRRLAGLEGQLGAARQSAGGTSVELQAKAEEIQRARDTLVGLRQQLAAAEASAPVLPPAPSAVAGAVQSPAASSLGRASVPADYRALYVRAAATCRGLPWTVLAAVGAVESAHGQSTAAGVHSGANFAGAMGPMQFIAGTWAAYGVDGDGDGVRNVYDPDDAVFGAANYLCASGAGNVTTLRAALWDYNNADWYVEMVLDLAARL